MPPAPPVIALRGLSFRFTAGSAPVLVELDLDVSAASRTLVVGANGAGKTTLLRVVAGKHLVAREPVQVLGASPFHDTALSAGAMPIEVLAGVIDRWVTAQKA